MFQDSIRENHKNIQFLLLYFPIPKYVIAVVNTYLKYSFIKNISQYTPHISSSILTNTIINLSYYEDDTPTSRALLTILKNISLTHHTFHFNFTTFEYWTSNYRTQTLLTKINHTNTNAFYIQLRVQSFSKHKNIVLGHIIKSHSGVYNNYQELSSYSIILLHGTYALKLVGYSDTLVYIETIQCINHTGTKISHITDNRLQVLVTHY